MGEVICAAIGILFLFGSMSIIMSIITDKHYDDPIVKNKTIEEDLEDIIIAAEFMEDDEEGV